MLLPVLNIWINNHNDSMFNFLDGFFFNELVWQFIYIFWKPVPWSLTGCNFLNIGRYFDGSNKKMKLWNCTFWLCWLKSPKALMCTLKNVSTIVTHCGEGVNKNNFFKLGNFSNLVNLIKSPNLVICVTDLPNLLN